MKKRLLLGSIIVIALASGIIVRPDASVRADDDARIVTVHLDGETRTIATNATTVAGVIKRLGTTLSEHDKTEPALDETVRGADFTVNVYRARPITVTDGANNYTVVTAERSPAAIAKDAGFETKQEDDFIYRRNDEVYAGAPGTQMIILRSKNVTFSLYGKETELNTRAETVQDFLDEREIELETGDELNVPLTQAITEGMTISIDAVQRDTKTVEEDVPFEEEQIQDAQQPVGYREVKEAGVKGRKLVTYEIVIKNNGKPQRIVKKEVITKEPVKQVVVVGAKQAINVAGNCGEWLSQAGISDPNAVWLIGKESGCNPAAVNVASGACGIPQAHPCSKLPCPLSATGAVCQMNWMNSYVHGRYGNWAAARAFHAQNGWY